MMRVLRQLFAQHIMVKLDGNQRIRAAMAKAHATAVAVILMVSVRFMGRGCVIAIVHPRVGQQSSRDEHG